MATAVERNGGLTATATATATGEHSTIEIHGKGSLGVVTCRHWYWRVRAGAVIACRWIADDGGEPVKLLIADELGLQEGELVEVECGDIVSRKPAGPGTGVVTE